MDHNTITTIIDAKFKTINKLIPKVITHFETETIYQFRLEVKRLRAFLRLVSVQKGNQEELQLPKKLKTFYGYAGIIRNLQLQQQKLIAHGQPEETLSYLDRLSAEQTYWQVQVCAFMGDDTDLSAEQKKIKRALPDTLSKEAIINYIGQKAAEIKIFLLHPAREDNLHHIRKILKDLLYNRPFIESYLPAMCSAGLPRFQTIESIVEALVLFRDLSIRINLLEPGCRGSRKNIPLLDKISDQWQGEKQQLKNSICQLLLELKLIHAPALKAVKLPA